MSGGYRFVLHNEVRDVLRDFAAVKHPGQTSTEVHPFYGDFRWLRVDFGISVPFARGIHCYDIGIISHCSDIRIREAMEKPGAACTAYEELKRKHYGPAIADAAVRGVEVKLTPLIFDMYGAMGEAALSAVPGLIKQAGSQMEGDSTSARATVMAAQWLFAALTKQVANLVIRYKVAA